MSFVFPSKEAAQQRADELNASVRLVSKTRRYVVDRYPDGTWPHPAAVARYGIRLEYLYADRPEIGWINGGFVWNAYTR